MTQPRLNSKVVWASIIAQLITIGQLTGLFQRIGIDAGVVGDVTAAVLQVLVLFGILNNPTDKDGY
jgi:uncharacterized membrane protein